jgi:RimJ/RimL family protein N-acetyltransferase
MLRAARLTTPRLVVEPLRPEDAAQLAPALDDPALHAFIGGAPSAEEELRERYARLAAGQSPDGAEDWLNWVVRDRATGDPVGTIQATVRDVKRHAELAWVIVTSRQGQGLATEAATAVRDALRAAGVDTFIAHIHLDHAASAAVARRLGMRPTRSRVDGEVRWSAPAVSGCGSVRPGQ